MVPEVETPRSAEPKEAPVEEEVTEQMPVNRVMKRTRHQFDNFVIFCDEDESVGKLKSTINHSFVNVGYEAEPGLSECKQEDEQEPLEEYEDLNAASSSVTKI